jgi:hypothetical protein
MAPAPSLLGPWRELLGRRHAIAGKMIGALAMALYLVSYFGRVRNAAPHP